MKLVDDVRNWWRWFSTWLIASSGTILLVYENVEGMKDKIPDRIFHYLMGILLFLIFVGRVIKQSKPTS